MQTIEFWFDFSSAYGYFASLEIDSLARRCGRTVQWRPFMLGTAFRKTGVKGLSSTPLKGDYARRDWSRIARRHGYAFALPPFHPIVALPCSRAFYWIEERHPDAAAEYAKRVFHAHYVANLDLRINDAAAAVAEQLHGVDAVALREALDRQETKEKFAAISDSAVERGIFGSPFFLVDGEPFWGWDRMAQMEDWIRTGGW